jgi:hypothetical protein
MHLVRTLVHMHDTPMHALTYTFMHGDLLMETTCGLAERVAGCVSLQWQLMQRPTKLERASLTQATPAAAAEAGAAQTLTHHLTLGGISCPHAEISVLHTPTVSTCLSTVAGRLY